MGAGSSTATAGIESAANMGIEVSQLQHQSVKVAESAGPGYGPVYRSALVKEHVHVYYEDVRTMYDAFLRGLRISRDRPCLGHRSVLPDGSRGDYEWVSYAEVDRTVRRLSSGLASLGLAHKSPLGVYSLNRPEWYLAQLACYCRDGRVVALYDTLGPTAVSFILDHAEVQIVVCSRDKVGKLLELKDSASLKVIVSMDEGAFEAAHAELASERGILLHTLQSVMELGDQNILEPLAPKPESLATIMYTSGTTGMPKGAMLTHGNIVAMLAGVMKNGVIFRETDVHISYLPLAHIFEQVVQGICLLEGGAVGYWQGQVPKLFEDIACLRPTIFPSVPRLFNRLYDKVINAVNEASGTKKYLFDWGYSSKRFYVDRGNAPTHAVWDRLVFGKIQARLGGRVRMIITGSAPISKEVYQFLQICFCCPVIQGYGLTETAAGLTSTWPADTTSGHVGSPLGSCDVALFSVPDMNYDANGTPACGEVCVKGPNVMLGYYKDEAQTAEVLRNGWFHTGDIGRWNENGTLTIIDRKKNIFKLSQGEYVAPDVIESVYLKNTFVQQIFVHGDSLQSSLVAVVVPDPETLLPWAEKNGKPVDLSQLCRLSEVRQFFFDQLTRTGKEYNLKGFEHVKAIYLSAEPFSVEHDLLTPTFKMKRPQLKKHFESQIDDMYASLHDM